MLDLLQRIEDFNVTLKVGTFLSVSMFLAPEVEPDFSYDPTEISL